MVQGFQPFQNWRIARKIIGGYVVAIAVAVIGTSLGLAIGQAYAQQARATIDLANREVELLLELENTLNAMRLHPQQLPALLGSPIGFDYEAAKFLGYGDTFARQVEDFQALLEQTPRLADRSIADTENLLPRYQAAVARYEQFVQQVWEEFDIANVSTAERDRLRQEIALAFSRPEATQLNIEFERLAEQLLGLKGRLRERQTLASRDLERAENLRWLLAFGSMGLSSVLAIAIGRALGRGIARPLETVTQVARQTVQNADFQARVPVETRDEVGSLAASFNQLVAWAGDYTQALAAAKAEADAANRAKSDFLANMSHELRTPLNGILGYTQILQRAPDLNARRRDLNIIYQSGHHLLTLIEDILDLAKIEARKFELRAQPLHLPSFLSSIGEMIRVRAEAQGLAFRQQHDPDLPVSVVADEKRLRQVLLNLLSNAAKFTAEGGISFRTELRALEQGSCRLRFSVQDTGVGMTPAEIETIFQPFEQAGDASQRAAGTGLGLAISSHLVELMGSRIQVESEPGVGSRFWFEVTLPIATDWLEAAVNTRQGRIVGYRGPRRRLLVVDDKELNRAVIVEALAPLGFECLQAEQGEAGLALAEQANPDLIIADLVMPVMDGFELARQLRRSPRGQDVIIIASSASVLAGDQIESLAAGCNAFLPKPIDLAELLATLQKFLQLEWDYAAVETAADRADPATIAQELACVPPAAELAAMQHCARLGDIHGIEVEARRLQAQDRRYAAFSQRVLQLAAEFDDSAISQLIQEAIANSST